MNKHPGEHLVAPEEWPMIAETFRLTPRELSVMILFFQGKPCLQMARLLAITPRTIRHHIEQIHRKMDVGDQVELVLAIVEARDDLRHVPLIWEAGSSVAEEPGSKRSRR